MIWKDRLEQYPHRYTLTNVSGSTYDFAKVTGEVIESGTPVNAENLNKLIQRDGDDIKDTVTTFTEGTRTNIATGEKTSTIFGKIKKWFTDLKAHAFTTPSATLNEGTTSVPSDKLLYDTAALKANTTDLKPHAFNDLATVQGTETDKAPTNLLLKNSTLAREYRAILDIPTITTASPIDVIFLNMVEMSRLTCYPNIEGFKAILPSDAPNIYGKMIIYKHDNYRGYAEYLGHDLSTLQLPFRFFGAFNASQVNKFTGWQRVLLKKDISTVMPLSSAAASNDKVLSEKVVYDEFAKTAPLANPTFTGTVTVPAPTNATDAARLQDVTGLSAVYDIVIKTQAAFEALIADSTWFGTESVAFVGQFTLSTPASSGVKIPATVKQIHGFWSAKITITDFQYNSSTAKGGLWYDTTPTTQDYSIRDLEVRCTGTDCFGFVNCNNLSNCTGTTTGINGISYSFRHCNNLSNCTGTATGTVSGYGFVNCNNLSNCTGTATGTVSGYGFINCNNLSNCTGTATGTDCFGFFNINYAVNCKDGGSSTNMWGGTNKNIDLDTCCKTPVTANNTTLNT